VLTISSWRDSTDLSETELAESSGMASDRAGRQTVITVARTNKTWRNHIET
jgi:hypothetical protein